MTHGTFQMLSPGGQLGNAQFDNWKQPLLLVLAFNHETSVNSSEFL